MRVNLSDVAIGFYSFRVQSDGYLGVHFQRGEMDDEEGYARARRNLALKRPYPYMLETGTRHRDMTERVMTDQQMMEIAGRRWTMHRRGPRPAGV